MDQLKANLFWIILGLIVATGVGLWVTYLPSVDEAKTNAKNAAEKVKQIAESKNTPVRSPEHVKAVQNYGKEVDARKTELYKKWETQKIDLKFADVPSPQAPTIEFDNYIGKLRDAMAAKMTAAGVKVPDNWPAMTFAGSGTDDKSQELTRHRDYRLRYMAVLEEVIDAVCSKTGNVEVRTFETDPSKPDSPKTEPVGPIEFVKFAFHTPDETAKIEASNYEKALQTAQRKSPTGVQAQTVAYKGPEAPLDVSSVDIEFKSHISAVPGVLRKIESSSRYFGMITKTDFERGKDVFPPTKDVKGATDPLFTAKFVPTTNTYYGEGPVRVIVTMSILEYNKKKAEEFEKPPAPPPAPKNAPKPK